MKYYEYFLTLPLADTSKNVRWLVEVYASVDNDIALWMKAVSCASMQPLKQYTCYNPRQSSGDTLSISEH